jgi:hypothetical protein
MKTTKTKSKLILKVFQALLLVILVSGTLFQDAKASNKYSVTTGNWNSTATWSLTSGGSSGAPVPVAGDAVIIEGGFTVTVNASTASLTSLTISSGSTLSTTSTFTVSATTITVNGTYINGSTGTLTGTMTVGSSGTYRHNINGGTLKAATWNTGSTCLVTGITSTTLTVTGHSFSNFTWNSSNTVAVSLSPTAINGNLNIISGGSGTVRINTTPFTIGGNLNLSGTAYFQIASSTTAKTLTVNGNFSMSSGTCTFSNGSGIGTLNIKGNYSHTGGTITETSSGSGAIVFLGNTTQTYTSGGTVSNTINYTVNSGTTLQMADASTVVSGAAFTLSAGATLGIKSTAGITSSGATGNIQTTTRTFSTTANYIYNGSSAQVTGSGLPATVNNLTMNNSAGATSSGNITVNGILNLQCANASATVGCLNMGTDTLKMGSLATTTGTGDVAGMVMRSHTFNINTQYNFGSQYTTFTFTDANTKPTWIICKTTIGTIPGWSGWSPNGKVSRYYNVACSNNSSTSKAVINMRYLTSELDATYNEEYRLSFWHKFMGTPYEYGKSNQDFTYHTLGVTGIVFGYYVTSNLSESEVAIAYASVTKNTWVGGATGYETDWGTAPNWSGGIPTSASNILIPPGRTYYPSLTASVVANTIEISNGASLSANAYDITISGTNGAWINNGTFTAGTGNVIFNHGVVNDIVTVGGTTSFYNIECADYTTMQPVSGCTLRIAGVGIAHANSVVDFSTINNTVEWNGTNQTIVNPNGIGGNSGYYNLTLSGSGTKTMPSSTMQLNGSFNISGTTTVTALGIINTAKNLTIGSGTSFTAGAYSHTVGGNFTNSGTFTSTGSTITMNGSTEQTISGSTMTFNNLIISNPVSVTLGVNTIINGDLNVTSGNIFDLGAYTINRSSAGGTLTISGSLKLGANSGGQAGSNFPLNFGTVTMTGGTIEYYGSSQTVYTGTTYNSMIIGGNGTITLPSSDMTLDDLTLNNSNGVSLSSNITVNRALNLMSGMLTLGTKNLTLGSTAAITGTPSSANMVVSTGTGDLRKVFTGTGSFTFPVGSNSGAAEYSPVTLNFTSGTFSSAYVGVNLTKGKHPNNNSSINYLNRYWVVTQSGISNFSCGVTILYLPSDVVGNETDIWCGKYDGSTWTLLSAANIESNELSGTVTSFSTFTGGEEGTLPVSLSSLNSSVNGRNVTLSWVTNSEHNNAGFEIQRAEVNNKKSEYNKVGYVNGSGTKNKQTTYIFNDNKLNSGKYSYRLKQIDYNGNFEYFILNGDVEIGIPTKYDLSQNYPNPFNPTTKIDFQIPVDSKVTLKIYDITGREVFVLLNNEFKAADFYTIEFNAINLSSGCYFYRINANNFNQVKKMILLK